MSELLPCPCCGGAANTDIEHHFYSVGCEGCGLQTIYHASPEIAISTWNTRTPPTPIEDTTDADTDDGSVYASLASVSLASFILRSTSEDRK